MPAAIELGRSAIDAGAAAIWIGQYPAGHSPSHVELEPLWAMCAEAGVPIVLHVAGAGANVMSTDYFDNGGPPVPDFHGGDTNFKSIDYLSIPLPVMQTLNALIIDGVLMRHPDLRDRRDRARRDVGAGLDADDGFRARGVPQERRPVAGDGPSPE